MCPKKTVYPLNQPVVSRAGITKSDMSSSVRCDQVTTSDVSTFEVENKLSVDSYKVLCEVSGKDSADNLEMNPDEFCWEVI